MQTSSRYSQLQPEDRMTIARMTQQGCSVRAMARTLQRSASTISRELARNTSPNATYGSHLAQQACQVRRIAARPATKLDVDSLSWMVVRALLSRQWSPQQIAGTLQRIYPDQPRRHLSHETIYNAIYAQPRGELRRQLIACLRHGHSTRLPRTRGNDRRGQGTLISGINNADQRRKIWQECPPFASEISVCCCG